MRPTSWRWLGLLLATVPAGAAAAEDGAALYRRHCLACHQADGQGVPAMQPPLVGSPTLTGSPDLLIAWILNGSGDSPGGDWANCMPPFSGLTDREIATLVRFLFSAFGDGPADVTPGLVAASR